LLPEQADQGKCLKAFLQKTGFQDSVEFLFNGFLIWERVTCRDQMFRTLECDGTKPRSCQRAVLSNHNGIYTLSLRLYFTPFNNKTRHKQKTADQKTE
jgi:hypothetical protein